MNNSKRFLALFVSTLFISIFCVDTVSLCKVFHFFDVTWDFNNVDYLDTSVTDILLSLLTLKFSALFVAHAPHDDVFSLDLSPEYDRDKTVFSIVRGTLLKSINGGCTWKRIVKGLDNKFQLSSLKCSPQNKDILFMSSHGDGIYKSQDRGNSWFKVNNGLETISIDRISIFSNSADIVFATGTEYGLYRTTDGGASWSKILEPRVKITALSSPSNSKDYVVAGDERGILYFSQTGGEIWEKNFSLVDRDVILALEFSPNFSKDKTFFVGTKKNGIFKTIDNGISFSKINQGLSDISITSIAVSKNYGTDSTIYISTWQKGIFYSRNAGKIWQNCSAGLTKDRQADDVEFKRPHFSSLKITDTFSKDKIIFLAGFDGMFKSTNGGQTWQKIDTLSANIIVGLSLSPNYSSDATVAISTYLGGAYISEDRGYTWSAINNGLLELKRYVKQGHIVRLFDILFSPEYHLDNTIFSSSWRRFYISRDQGKNWWTQYFGPRTLLSKFKSGQIKFEPGKLPVRPPLIISISPNYALDKTLYLGTKTGDIFQAVDGVIMGESIGSISQRIYSLAISPNFPSDRTLYGGVENGIYRSIDGGVTWEYLVNTPRVINLAISPDYKVDETVFAGTTRGILKTQDKGKSWIKLVNQSLGEDYYVEAIAISPSYRIDRTLLVSIRGKGLFKSQDNGETFVAIGTSLLDSNHLLSNFGSGYNSTSVPIKFSPSYSTDSTVYGFSGQELFRSVDGGNTWESIFMPNFSNKNSITSLYHLFTAPLQIFGIRTKRD